MCVCVCVSNIRVFVCISRNSGDIIKMEWSGFHFLFEKSLFFFLDRHALWCNRMLLHSPFFFFFFFHGCKLIIQTSCLYPLSTYTPHFFWKKKNPKIWESVYVLRQFGSCYVETSFYFIYFPFSFLRIIRNSRCGLTRHRFQRIQDCAQCPCLSLLIASRNHSLTPPPNTHKNY